MPLEYIQTSKAPQAIGPYSQAIKAGGFVYTSGQIALVPGKSDLVSEDIEAQTGQVMENLKAVLLAAGSGFDRVLETTIYLADMGDFQKVNAIYEQAMGSHKPARATVQVAALPKQARIEIKMTALA